jgi:hypothetical protein
VPIEGPDFFQDVCHIVMRRFALGRLIVKH